MLLEMIMVQVVFAKELPVSKPAPPEIKIEELVPIREELIRDEDKKILQCKDLSNLNRPFITKNHFRDINNKRYIVAFKLIPDKSGENIEDYNVFYGIDEEASEQHKLSREGDLFVDKSGMKYVQGNDGFWKVDYINDPTTGTLGYVHPGYTKIFLKKKNHNALYDHERLLLVLPSSVNIKQLEAMVKEIMYIRRELISIDEDIRKDAKAYFGLENEDTTDVNWERQLKWIKSCLVQIEPYLKRINNLPKKNLKTVKDEKSYHRIRKITPSIIEQYLQNYSRRKYIAEGADNSLDIFEHRLLKRKLYELKKYVEMQNEQNTSNVEEEKTAIINKMAKLADIRFNNANDINFEDISAEWEKYKRKVEKDIKDIKDKAGIEFDKNFLKKSELKYLGSTPGTVVSMDLELRHVKFTRMVIEGGFLKISFNFSNSMKNRDDSFWCDSRDNIKHSIDEIVFSSEDPCMSVAFIEGILKHSDENYNETETLIQIKMEGLVYYYDGPKVKVLKIYKIDQMVINGEELIISSDKDGALSKLKELYVSKSYTNDKDIDTWDGNLNTIKGLENSLKNNENSLTPNLEYYFKFVIKKIDDYLKFPVFEGVRDTISEPWRITQIFTNDYNYHQVYRQLYLLDKICDYSFSENGDKILLEKVDRLYEFWILVKILEHLLIRQKWVTVDGGRDVSDIFRYIFSNNLDKNFPKVCLKHDGDSGHSNLTLELYFDTELGISLSDLIQKNSYNAKKLRPDFLFRVKNESKGFEKVFILDAKYRDYEVQGRSWWIYKDLIGVCKEKYIKKVENELGINNIATAFIVHSDMTNSARWENTNKYLGKYVTFNAFANRRIMIPIMDGKSGDKCQIGSFYLTPFVNNEYNQSNDNLNTYFAMMFEYFMEEWKTCWNCGSNSVEIKTLFTAGGKLKYHMTCNKCKSFWVKNHDYNCVNTMIIKHLINYHIEEEHGSTWNLKCPSCESYLLTNKIKRYKQ